MNYKTRLDIASVSHCARDRIAEVVIRQPNNLLPMTTETIATVSFRDVKSTFHACLEEQT